MNDSDTIEALQIRLAHAERIIEDLSDEVAHMSKRLAQHEKALKYLAQKSQEQEEQTGHSFSDPPPPHY